MKTQIFKVTKRHIAEEWSEEGTDDGYWIALKPGWKWADDVVGAVHAIHANDKKSAHNELVMPCICRDCKHS